MSRPPHASSTSEDFRSPSMVRCASGVPRSPGASLEDHIVPISLALTLKRAGQEVLPITGAQGTDRRATAGVADRRASTRRREPQRCSVGRAMRRDQLPPHKTATYVLARYKTVYVSVPKAACTSLKWLVAELQGEDPERFHRSLSREVGRAMTIHRRDLWRHTPMLHELPDDELAAISPDDGWFVFAVVRHPSARVWAAWQSKFLLREPRWMDEFADAPWLPRVPRSTDDVVEDFARFVGAIAEDPGQRVMRDRHFMTQTRLVGPATTPYTKVYETSEIPSLMEDLDAHLRAHGWEGTLALGQSNETPLAPLASLFTPEVTEGIRSVYGVDFETFGFDDVLPRNADPAAGYPHGLLVAVGLLAERGERLGDVAVRAQSLLGGNRKLRGENKTLRGENKTLRGENKTLRGENKALRARPRIGAVARRVYRRLSISR